jgi:hypothetical protein
MYVINFLADCRFGGLSLWWIVALNYLADCHLANCRLADCRTTLTRNIELLQGISGQAS